MEDMKPLEAFSKDNLVFLDSKGRYLTQSLFLELAYNTDAPYTLKGNDHFHNGKLFISPKKIYLEMEDATEYEFANTMFQDWSHWQKICNNKILGGHIEDWRLELELKLRSKAMSSMIKQAKTGSFQATKWLADRGWEVRGAGRPTKEDVMKETAIRSKAEDEFSADIIRLQKHG